MSWWVALGVLVGAFLFWVSGSNMKLSWYEWLLAILGLILIVFAIQNYSASIEELESRAASTFLMMFGLPGLILAGLGFGLPWMRAKKA